MQKNAGFTLIELLVVVLIIGILSAVALPQYEKAVWKSRASEMMTTMKALGSAQDLYHLANSSWASSVDELDIDVSGFSTPEEGKGSPCGMGNRGDGAVRQKGWITFSLNGSAEEGYILTGSAFNAGKYECGGFVYVNQTDNAAIAPGRLYCWQHIRGSAAQNKFCELFGPHIGRISGWNLYSVS